MPTTRPRPAREQRATLLGCWVLLVAAASAASCARSAPRAPAAVPVTAVRLEARPAAITEEYPAQLEASNTVEIRPRVGGVLEKVAAAEGQAVKAGQLLFVIDPQPYEAALAQAKATLAQNQAAQAKATRDLARAQPLAKGDLLSQRELDAAVAANDATAAQVRASEAAVKTAELNLGYTTVTAPIAGVMSRVEIRLGGLVSAYNTLLTTVYQTNPLYVNFSVSEQRLLELQRELGRAPDQTNPSHRAFNVYTGDGQELPSAAALDFIAPAVDSRTDTLPIRLTIPNPNGLLRAGQYVNVRTSIATRAESLLIPLRAVQQLQSKRFVWIVDAEGRAQQRDVVLGARVGSDSLVESGLAAGDTVVVDGVQKLSPGTAVSVSAPASSGQP